jgi:ankyrin repeat protein
VQWADRKFSENGRYYFAMFEDAVEAVVHGDIATLERLLRERPGLIRERSSRPHRATLLHYTGANGVEDERQKTPHNIVRLTEMLLDAGAEIDALGDMYGGSTTLCLVATSVHPARAGVQAQLIDLLLQRGASVSANPAPLINSCLANGRGDAAELLARRGAPIDFEGAAGVGRVDLVRSLFANATTAQRATALAWAAQFGRTDVVRFLLDKGDATGLGLHWAAWNAQIDAASLLLDRNAPVDARDDRWNATPLGWALHAWHDPPQESTGRYHDVARLLVDAGATVERAWLDDDKVRGDAGMLLILKS